MSPGFVRDRRKISLRTLFVEIDFPAPSAESQDYLSSDIAQWPRFRVLIAATEEFDTDLERTIVRSDGANRRSPHSQLATAIYELLGGRSSGAGVRSSPLPALNEEANRLLLDAIQGQSDDWSDFWEAWTMACGCEGATELWCIPRWAANIDGRYDVLDLNPDPPRGTSIRLVARSQFRIGRSRRLTDYPALYRGTSEDADSAARISRIHLLATISQSSISLIDGDGSKPTVNGSTLDGLPLSPTEPLTIDKSAILQLGGSYGLELIVDQHSAMTREWKIEGAGRIWPEAEAGISSVRFRPTRGTPVRDAIWLFGVVGFRLKPTGEIEWSDSESDGYFIRAQEKFWIANARLDPTRLRVDDAGVLRRQVIPLCPGQVVDLHDQRFTVGVEYAAESA